MEGVGGRRPRVDVQACGGGGATRQVKATLGHPGGDRLPVMPLWRPLTALRQMGSFPSTMSPESSTPRNCDLGEKMGLRVYRISDVHSVSACHGHAAKGQVLEELPCWIRHPDVYRSRGPWSGYLIEHSRTGCVVAASSSSFRRSL